MTIYVSLELSLCFCMELGDLRKKPQHGQLEKLEGSDPASVQSVCKEVVTIVEDLVQVNIFP